MVGAVVSKLHAGPDRKLEGALSMLERITQSQGLAISPFLKDALCFRQFADNPRYEGRDEHLEARQAEFRATVTPATLLIRTNLADVRPLR